MLTICVDRLDEALDGWHNSDLNFRNGRRYFFEILERLGFEFRLYGLTTIQPAKGPMDSKRHIWRIAVTISPLSIFESFVFQKLIHTPYQNIYRILLDSVLLQTSIFDC